MALNRPGILEEKRAPEEKKEEAILSADQITAELKYIREKIIDRNYYKLNTMEYVSLKIVLNTLDFLKTEMLINKHYQDYNNLLDPNKEMNVQGPDEEKSAVIHLENYFRAQAVQLGAAYSTLLNINKLALCGPLQKGSMQFKCEYSILTCRVIDIDDKEKTITIQWNQIQPLIGALELKNPDNTDQYVTLVLANQKTFLYAVLGIAPNLVVVEYANDVTKSYQNDPQAKIRADLKRQMLLEKHSTKETLEALEKISLWKHPDWLNNLLVRSLFMPFIQSIKTIENVERDLSMRIFCEKLAGNCIDARTRGAITYAQSEHPEFTHLLEKIFKARQALCKPSDDSYSYFGCIETILDNDYFGNIFTADRGDNGIRKLPGLLDVEVLCDEKAGVEYFLRTLLDADLNNSFLSLYKIIEDKEKQKIFFKLLLKEEEFLRKLTFTKMEQEQFDELFGVDSFLEQLFLNPGAVEILLDKISKEKCPHILKIAIHNFSYLFFKRIYGILRFQITKMDRTNLFINTIGARPENLTVLSPDQLAESCLLDSVTQQPLSFLHIVRILQATPEIAFDYTKQFVDEILKQGIYKKIITQPNQPENSRHLREFLNIISTILCANEKEELTIHSKLLTELKNHLASSPKLIAKFIAEEDVPSEEKNVFPLTEILKDELTGQRRCFLDVYPHLLPSQYSAFFNILFEENFIDNVNFSSSEQEKFDELVFDGIKNPHSNFLSHSLKCKDSDRVETLVKKISTGSWSNLEKDAHVSIFPDIVGCLGIKRTFTIFSDLTEPMQPLFFELLKPFFHDDTPSHWTFFSSLAFDTQKESLRRAFEKLEVKDDAAADKCLQSLKYYVATAGKSKRIFAAARAMYVLATVPDSTTLRAICDAIKQDRGVSLFKRKSTLVRHLETYLKESAAPSSHQKRTHSWRIPI